MTEMNGLINRIFDNDFAINEVYRTHFEPDFWLMEEYKFHIFLVESGIYNSLNETFHVSPETMEPARDILMLILQYLDIYTKNPEGFEEKFKENYLYYTKWNFLTDDDSPQKIRCQNGKYEKNIFSRPFVKSNEEQLHPIKICFSYDEYAENEIGVFQRSKRNDIIICLEVKKLIEYSGKFSETNDLLNAIKSLVAHELTHIIEQYIKENINGMDSKENGIYSDFASNNDFNLQTTSDDYKIISQILYDISVEEQHARYNQLDNIFSSLVVDFVNRRGVFNLYNSILNYLFNSGKSGEDVLCALTLTFLRFDISMEASRLNSFYNYMTELGEISQKHTESKKTKLLLIIGFYLYRHHLLNSKKHSGFTMSKQQLGSFFTKQNIQNYIDGKKTEFSTYIPQIRKLVFDSIKDNFLSYEKRVYQIVYKYVSSIYEALENMKASDVSDISSLQAKIRHFILEEKMRILKRERPELNEKQCREYAEHPYRFTSMLGTNPDPHLVNGGYHSMDTRLQKLLDF